MTYKNYFEDINAQKQIEKIAKKYKNKKIVLYGIGEYFEEISQSFDLSKLNIVGVCDLKLAKDKNYNWTKYPAIAPDELKNTDFDIIFITAIQELTIIEYLKQNKINTKHKKIDVLLKPSYFDLLKIFFSKKEKYLG